jgi:acetyltransferase-like isoleucine patch superfamily enzyme
MKIPVSIRWFDAAFARAWPLIGRPATLLVERALASHSVLNGRPDPLLFRSMIYGDPARLKIHHSAVVNNALFNLISGTVTVGPFAFFGHGVTILTGTHDLTKFGAERQAAVPREGRDVVIGEGVWLSTNVTVVGPCNIGDHAVVGAGSLVLDDVEAYSVVAGSPARLKKMIARPEPTQGASSGLPLTPSQAGETGQRSDEAT